MSDKEKISLFKHIVHVVKKRGPVIADTGNYDTSATIVFTNTFLVWMLGSPVPLVSLTKKETATLKEIIHFI